MSVKATAWAYDQQVKPVGAKFILVVIADHCNSEGYSYPSVTRITEMTGMGESTVREHTTYLEEIGLIKKAPRFAKNGKQRSNGYWLLMPEVNPDADDGLPSENQTPSPSRIRRGTLQKSSSPPLQNSEGRITEPSLEPSLEPPPTPENFETVASDSGEGLNSEEPVTQSRGSGEVLENQILVSAEQEIFTESKVEKTVLEPIPAALAPRPPARTDQIPFGSVMHGQQRLLEIQVKNKTVSQLAFGSLWQFLVANPRRYQNSRSACVKADSMLEDWLSYLPEAYILEVVRLCRSGQGDVLHDSFGACETWLTNPAAALKKHPELAEKLNPKPSLNACAVQSETITPGQYRVTETRNGQTVTGVVTVCEVYDNCAFLESGHSVLLPLTRGWERVA